MTSGSIIEVIFFFQPPRGKMRIWSDLQCPRTPLLFSERWDFSAGIHDNSTSWDSRWWNLSFYGDLGGFWQFIQIYGYHLILHVIQL